LTQIESEGNDPTLSGESYGTPHDLATIYNRNAKGDVPDGYDEEDPDPVGRPKEKASIFKTDQSAFGRDPLGSKDMKDIGTNKSNYKSKPSAYAMEGLKKVAEKKRKKMTIFEQKSEEPGLLDEKNIIGEDI
jgi:hypothetical protein